MKKWLKWLLIALGVAIAGLVIYFIVRDALREEAVLTYPDTVIVQNATEYHEINKILKAISHHVLEYDTINIAIAHMPKNMEEVGELDIKAYVYKNIFQDKAYLIFVSSTLKLSEYKRVMVHEMAHIDQMEIGDLIQAPIDEAYVVYKGDTINFHKVPYEQRPHEIDAEHKENQLYKQLEKVLYK